MSFANSHRCMRSCNPNSYAGFTLIELMIAVAIIGLLAALSISRYEMNQRKSRQAEAKLALSSIYSLEKGFYSEYAAYIPAFDAIGYAPEGTKRFYQHNACDGPPWGGTVTGYAGAAAVTAWPQVGMPWPGNFNSDPTGNCTEWVGCGWGNDPQTLRPGAWGNLCATCYTDLWTIDEFKNLSNCSPGLH